MRGPKTPVPLRVRRRSPRTTFNRFIQRLSHHAGLVEACFVQVTGRLKTLLPDLGQEVAIDSTTVRSHSNPNRKRISDPEASWTAKTSARSKQGGKEWFFGYKVPMVADANHGVPIGQFVTTAKRNDSPELPTVIARAEALYPWFRPTAVIADRGYDSKANHRVLNDKGILPIIHIKRPANAKLYDGIYTEKGVPTCVGRVPMEYVRSDPALGHLYRCRWEVCHTWPVLSVAAVITAPTRSGKTRRRTFGCSGSSAGTGPSGRPSTTSGRPLSGCSSP